MTVYLVPVGAGRYQLYVEMSAEETGDAAPSAEGSGWVARQIQRFRSMLAEAEQARLRRESGEPDHGSGLWHAIMRRIAETVAEQRLLWHLRHQSDADIVHPDDVDGAQALHEVRAEFARDVARHFRWMIVDGAIMAITGVVLTLIPGPNLLAWYFTFRAIAHFFSWRGARKGLTQIAWHTVASAPLSEVRTALGHPSHERRLQLLAIGERLGLKHLAGFVERVSATSGRA